MKSILIIGVVALVACGDMEKASKSAVESTKNVKVAAENVKDTKKIVDETIKPIEKVETKPVVATQVVVATDSDSSPVTALTKDEWVDPVTGNMWFLGRSLSVAEATKVEKLCPGVSKQASADELEEARDAGLFQYFRHSDEDYYVWVVIVHNEPDYANYDRFFQAGYMMYLGKDEAQVGNWEIPNYKSPEAKDTYYRTLCIKAQ